MSKDEKAYAIIAGNQVLYFELDGFIEIEMIHDTEGVAQLIETIAEQGKSVRARAVNPQTLEVDKNHIVMLFPGPGTLLSVRPWEEFLEYAKAAQKEAERRVAEQKRAAEDQRRKENALMQQLAGGGPGGQPLISIPHPIPGKRR